MVHVRRSEYDADSRLLIVNHEVSYAIVFELSMCFQRVVYGMSSLNSFDNSHGSIASPESIRIFRNEIVNLVYGGNGVPVVSSVRASDSQLVMSWLNVIRRNR
jgi:hypothetical protein